MGAVPSPLGQRRSRGGITPYDTTELELAVGEEVVVLDRDDVSGWWWCRRADGAEGWVPVSALDPIA